MPSGGSAAVFASSALIGSPLAQEVTALGGEVTALGGEVTGLGCEVTGLGGEVTDDRVRPGEPVTVGFPPEEPTRRQPARLQVLLAAALVVGVLTAGCGMREPAGPTVSTSATGAPATALAQVSSTIKAFDRTAGGAVSAQQKLLNALVAPGQRAAQRACPPATTTLLFDPVYSDLAASPNWAPKSGSLAGIVYSLPTLIRIYTGTRITGTDVADLHVAISDGRATLTAFCVA